MANKAQAGTSFGIFWFAGWLFSLGYLSMGFWQGLLAIFIWPYYIGVALGAG